MDISINFDTTIHLRSGREISKKPLTKPNTAKRKISDCNDCDNKNATKRRCIVTKCSSTKRESSVNNADNCSPNKQLCTVEAVANSLNSLNINNKATTSVAICTNNETEKQQVIAFYNQQYCPSQVVKLDNLNDLDSKDLLNVITCNQQGVLEVNPGRIYTNEPLVLIFDLNNIPVGEIARINDLLSTPATFNGEPIANSVTVVVMIDNNILTNNKFSPDFFRRLEKFTLHLSTDSLYAKNNIACQQDSHLQTKKSLLAQIKDVSHSIENNDAKVINFATATDGLGLLFGSLAFDDQGKPYFKNGCLHDTSNSNIVLQNAPWDDLEFTNTLTTAITQGGFRANGNWIKLHENLQLNKSFTSDKQIAELKNKYVIAAEDVANLEQHNCAVINPSNIDNALCNYQLHNGLSTTADTFSTLTSGCDYVLVTEKLNKKQWLQLLNKLSELDNNRLLLPIKKRKITPRIIDVSASSIANINKLMQTSLNNSIKYNTYSNKQDALVALKKNNLVYQITATTNWSELWQSVNLTSQENFTFNVQDTELLTALKQGKPIVFYGLETNFEILKQIENLLIKPSYLFLNGNKIAIDNANLCILLPEKFESTKLPKLLQSIKAIPLAEPTTIEKTPATKIIDFILEKLAENNLLPAQDKKTINSLFAKELKIAQKFDKTEFLLPIHYRKVANAIFAKQYRNKPEFYNYLKTQINYITTITLAVDDCNASEQEVDARALIDWMKQHPQADRKSLITDFWLLARHCGFFVYIGQIIENIKFAEVVGNQEIIDTLANILLSVAEDVIEDDKLEDFATRFNASSDDFHDFIDCYDGNVVDEITTAMLIAQNQLKTTIPISQLAKKLASFVYSKKGLPPEQQINNINELLTKIFPQELLQTVFKDLATNLAISKINIQRQQESKHIKLAARIKEHQIIFLEGSAGVGKSHMAEVAASYLQKYNPNNIAEPLVLNVGATTTVGDLLGEQQLIKINNDVYTEFVSGPILKWAMNDKPPILIINEANTLKPGILALLHGLLLGQISYNGKIYKLTEKHKVILTGNSANYDGRHTDAEIKESTLILPCKKMTNNRLAELIIQPALPEHLMPNIKIEITRAMLYLYTQYTEVLAVDLGPRDLKDILARINKIIAYQDNKIAPTQIHGAVWESFNEILAYLITDKFKLKKILNNYKINFNITGIDISALKARDDKFETFFIYLIQENKNLYLLAPSIKKLVRDYWLFLDSQGRCGLWIEGPAGWGKDCILDAVLRLWEKQEGKQNKFIHINANPNQWDKQVAIIKQAMQDGRKLVISEMNLLPSRYLEELFNDILNRKSTSGFMLFATVNPSSYNNRESLSPALLSRMTQIKLATISDNELYKILHRLYTNNQAMITWLFSNYLELSTELKKKQVPIELSLAKLLDTAQKLNNLDSCYWVDIFQQDYGLVIQMIGNTANNFEIQTPPKTLTTMKNDTQISAREKLLAIQEPSVKQLQFVNFNNISQGSNLSPTSYFDTDRFSVGDYRLQLCKIKVTPIGVLKEPIEISSKKVQTVAVNALPTSTPITLTQEQLLGTVELELYNDRWIALPGISYHDECVAISHTDLIDLGRCSATGMLVVKLKQQQLTPKKLKLDFIIKPTLTSMHDVQLADDLEKIQQDKYLTHLLDTEVFTTDVATNRSFRRLQQIKATTDKKQQINQLISWGRDFKNYLDISSIGSKALIDSMRYQTGTCLHRSIAVQVLAEYFGIATNIIDNACHSFVEFSFDNKQNWIQADLGGANNPETNLEIKEQSFLPVNYQQVNNNESIRKKNNGSFNIIDNNCHSFVEFSFDNKQNWIQADLGGANNPETSLEIKEQSFLPVNYQQVNNNESIRKKNNGSFDDIPYLLQQEISDLKKKPDQLIHFLNFLIENNDIYKSSFYSHKKLVVFTNDFYKTINSTTAVFNKVLPPIFQQIIALNIFNKDTTFFIESFFIHTYRQFKKDKITNNIAKSICCTCLPLVESNKIHIEPLLDIIEYLAQDNEYKDKAKEILDKYYFDFKKTIIKVDSVTSLESIENDAFTNNNTLYKSKVLERLLLKTTIKTDWSYTSTEKSPNINRLALRKPAFPITNNQKIKNRNIYLPQKGCEYYQMIYDIKKKEYFKDLKIAGINEDIISYDSFITWLFNQLSTCQFTLLVDKTSQPDYDNTADICNYALPNSSYSQLLGVTTATRRYYFSVLDQFALKDYKYVLPDLNPNRIKRVFGESAILITADNFGDFIDEFLDLKCRQT